MSLMEIFKNVLAGEAGPATHQQYDQVAQGIDHSVLASGVKEMMQSSQTPDFNQLVAQAFANASAEQKASILNTLLGSASPAVLSQLGGLIPGGAAGGNLTPAQAQSVSPSALPQLAADAEKHAPSVIDQMSSVFAAHPTLVKTLGTGAMIVALRSIAKRYPG